jgi:hypothetical protein
VIHWLQKIQLHIVTNPSRLWPIMSCFQNMWEWIDAERMAPLALIAEIDHIGHITRCLYLVRHTNMAARSCSRIHDIVLRPIIL